MSNIQQSMEQSHSLTHMQLESLRNKLETERVEEILRRIMMRKITKVIRVRIQQA